MPENNDKPKEEPKKIEKAGSPTKFVEDAMGGLTPVRKGETTDDAMQRAKENEPSGGTR